jgi:hypothetical protein
MLAPEFSPQPDAAQARIAADQRDQFGACMGSHPAGTAKPHCLIASEVSDRVA